MADEVRTYTGGCHCSAVRFEVKCAPIESVMECNCSHCEKKGLLLTFIPREQFTLKKGEEKLTEYRFNQKKIQHLFCNICGVQAFAYGQDNDGNKLACINVRTVDDIDLKTLTCNQFNGKNM